MRILLFSVLVATPVAAQPAPEPLIRGAPAVAAQAPALPDLSRERRLVQDQPYWSFEVGTGARLHVGLVRVRRDSFGRNYLTGDPLRERHQTRPGIALSF